MAVEKLKNPFNSFSEVVKKINEIIDNIGGGFDPTPTQLEAINSGATANKINQIASNQDHITDLQTDKLDTAGTGLTKNGTTLNHTNLVETLTTSKIGAITFDAQGHITGFTEKQIYLHSIGIKYANVENYYGTFNVFNENSSPLTFSDIATYLYSKGYTSAENQYPISGSDDFVVRYCAASSGGSPTTQFQSTGIMTGIFSADGITLKYVFNRNNTRTLSEIVGTGTWIKEINNIRIL